MNQTEDWDVIWHWQWFRRGLWQPHFRDVTHPEGRLARTAPIWNWVLERFSAKRVLDCNCGLGLRAILFHEAGYDCVGTDRSGVAIEHARELAESREMPVDFHHCPWERLGEQFEGEFDAIVNDAFSWTQTRTEMRFAAHNFATVLKPGGVFIFTGAAEDTTAEDLAAQADHAWQAAPRFQLRSDYEHGGTHLTLVVARDLTGEGIVENYVFVVRDEEGVRLETASVCNAIKWTWEDYQAVFKEAGFSRLESVRVPIGRKGHVLNVAHR